MPSNNEEVARMRAVAALTGAIAERQLRAANAMEQGDDDAGVEAQRDILKLMGAMAQLGSLIDKAEEAEVDEIVGNDLMQAAIQNLSDAAFLYAIDTRFKDDSNRDSKIRDLFKSLNIHRNMPNATHEYFQQQILSASADYLSAFEKVMTIRKAA